MSKIIRNNTIIEGNIVKKKKNDKLLELYNYLDERNFDNKVDIIDVDEQYIKSRYIENKDYNEYVQGTEFIKTVSKLHSSTISLKDVSKNKYKKIYNKILSNILYLKKYYEDKANSIEEEEYMSPSHYLFIRNYTSIDSALKYSTSSLKNWYKKVNNKSKERICVVHNNLSLNHFIKGDKNYLISFDNYLVDTPVLDLYKFYKSEGYKLDFKYLMDVYEEGFKLLDEEKILLNCLISIPPKYEDVKDEYLNCINTKDFFVYIYSSMNYVNENK